jgi:hypothetical protein
MRSLERSEVDQGFDALMQVFDALQSEHADLQQALARAEDKLFVVGRLVDVAVRLLDRLDAPRRTAE